MNYCWGFFFSRPVLSSYAFVYRGGLTPLCTRRETHDTRELTPLPKNPDDPHITADDDDEDDINRYAVSRVVADTNDDFRGSAGRVRLSGGPHVRTAASHSARPRRRRGSRRTGG